MDKEQTPAETILTMVDGIINLDTAGCMGVISPAYMKLLIKIRRHVALQVVNEACNELEAKY